MKISVFKIPPYVYPFFVFAVAIFANTLLSFPPDDGLRHIGMSAIRDVTWGDVYPFSRFNDFADYNPWFGYDYFLRIIFICLRAFGFSDITIKFIMVKTLSFIISLIAFGIIVHKSGIVDEINGIYSLTIYTLITLLLLSQFFMRTCLIRPFIFGTIYLAFSFGKGGVAKAVISAGLLTFVYPYLAWFYIVPASIGHILTGNKKFGIASAVFTIIFLLIQPESFWGLQVALFESAKLRQFLNMDITEFKNSFSILSTALFAVSFLVFFPLLFNRNEKTAYGNYLLAAYAIPSLFFVRYMVDVFMPLTFIVYGKNIYLIFFKLTDHILEKWKKFLAETSYCKILSYKLFFFFNNKSASNPLIFRSTLVFLFFILSVLIVNINLKQLQDLINLDKTLQGIPLKTTLLTTFNQQYQLLFVRPDLRLIPSCEIAFFNDQIKQEYKNFFADGQFYRLAKKLNVKYLIEAQDMYIDPNDARNLKLLSENSKLKVWRIE